MRELDLQQFRHALSILNHLLGKLEESTGHAVEQRKHFKLVSDKGKRLIDAEKVAANEHSQLNSQAVSIVACPEKGEETMKNLIKRADGRWMGRRTIDGKRHCVYGKTQRECYQKWLAMKNKPKSKKTTTKWTLSKYALHYIENYKKMNVAESTYKLYENVVKNHLNSNKLMADITTDDLQKKLNKLPATRIREDTYIYAKQIFSRAYKSGIIKKDVSLDLEKGNIKKGSRKAITLAEQKIIFDNLPNNEFGNRILFFLLTGARPGELRTVSKAKLKKNYLYIEGTKNKYAKRWVKISPKLYEILKKQKDSFFDYQTQPLRRRFKRFCEKLNLPAYDIYTLRHTFATNLYIMGAPEKDRQIYMGHASASSITNDVYTTYSPDTKKQDVLDIYDDLLPEF